MAIFDLDAKITEEDLSGINRKARQPVYLYVEAEREAGVTELRTALQEFLRGILGNPTLQASADVEICVFDQTGCTILKECGSVTDVRLEHFSQIHPTDGQSIRLAPVLETALDRIAAQKRKYRSSDISYGKPSLLVFTAGNLADEPWQLQEVTARPLREASVDILPVCPNPDHPILKKISSQGRIMQMPVERAYTELFWEIRNSMERLSRSTAATYQELSDSLVDGSQYFL